MRILVIVLAVLIGLALIGAVIQALKWLLILAAIVAGVLLIGGWVRRT